MSIERHAPTARDPHPELCAASSSATPGAIERHRSGRTGPCYYSYVPSSGGHQASVLVAVHGISRNARAHAQAFAPFAERHRLVLVAPRFGHRRFPDYQRLGRRGRGERADLALHDILNDVAARTGACTDRIFLFGYSGGGQFVHRFALVHPRRVAAYVVGAAGWYTFPDPTQPFPRGAQPTAKLPGIAFDLNAYLSVPATVLVGECDVEQDAALRSTCRIVAQQGRSRLERGRNWVDAMKAASIKHGVAGRFAYRTLPATAHSFRVATRRGGIAEAAVDALLHACSAEGAPARDEPLSPQMAQFRPESLENEPVAGHVQI